MLWVLGVVGAGDWIPANTADNWLHFALGVGMLALGFVTSARRGSHRRDGVAGVATGPRRAALRAGRRRAPRPASVRLQHLGEDLECDLGRRHASQVEADRAADLVGERAELLAALRLRATRAEGADEERSAFDAGSQGRDVEPLLVHERDERGVGVDLDLVGPRNDDLVGTRDALGRGEPGPRVDDGRVPAERTRERAERLRDVAGADGDEPRRGETDFDEDRCGRSLRGARWRCRDASCQRWPTPSPATTT